MEISITVVVPVLNRAGLITRCLDSIAAQDLRSLHLRVVDNGSDDGTPEVVRRWIAEHAADSGLHAELLREERRGAARARRTGTEGVTTEWIYFFDSDDVMLPGLLSEAMAAGRDSDLVCWPIVVERIDGSRYTTRMRRDIFRGQVFNSMLTTCCYMCRTSLLRRAGGWNPAAAVWDDWELGIRLLRQNPRIARLRRPGALMYRLADSITGTSFHDREGRWEEVLDMVERDAGDDRQLREMADYRRAILAAHYVREGYAESGRQLMARTLARTTCTPMRRLLLRLIYAYTARGGRAAYLLWR